MVQNILSMHICTFMVGLWCLMPLSTVQLAMNELTTLVVIGTDCTGSKSNYHTITTATALCTFMK